MATYNKFQSWVEFMQEGANVGSDQFVIALTNSAPIATNTVLGDLTQIAYTNLSTRNLTTATAAQSGGTYTLDFNDITLTSTGGSTGPFRYVVVYDDTVASDPLVCWFDYGSSITLAAGESLAVTFNASGLYTVT
jgi:hypothetical protein